MSNLVQLFLADRNFLLKLESICQDSIATVQSLPPDRPNRIQSGVTTLLAFWSTDRNLASVLETAAYIGCDHPFESLELFRGNLPALSMTDKSQPKSTQNLFCRPFDGGLGR
jgi:hypothetical protein